jgi:hypothetical protein
MIMTTMMMTKAEVEAEAATIKLEKKEKFLKDNR